MLAKNGISLEVFLSEKGKREINEDFMIYHPNKFYLVCDGLGGNGNGKTASKLVAETVKEIRRALVDADVNYKIAKEFTDKVKDEAMGQNVLNAVEPGQLMVFDQAADEVLAEQDSVLMVFGGEPVGPRHIFWNFVSSRPERIEQAKADWRAGRMALPPDDHDEFIPLPG